jgi:hypothetical protein
VILGTLRATHLEDKSHLRRDNGTDKRNFIDG